MDELDVKIIYEDDISNIENDILYFIIEGNDNE